MSSTTTLRLQDQIESESVERLVKAIKDGKSFRIVGDNIDFYTHVRDERKDRQGRMHHYFGSAAIVQHLSFEHLSNQRPPVANIQLENVMLTPDESEALVEDYAYLVMRVASTHIPYFSFLKDFVPDHFTDGYSHVLAKKSDVIPLMALNKNEQSYADVVDIFRYYESFLQKVYTKAGKELERVHIGGDQLTRERFSGAKPLMIGAESPEERFEHLRIFSYGNEAPWCRL